MGNSSFLDSLGFLCRNYYKVSDKDLKSLSDTIVSLGLSKYVDDGNLIRLKNLVDTHGLEFPCSYNYFSELWEAAYSSLDFDEFLGTFIKDGYASLKRLTENIFFSQVNQRSSEDEPGEIYYVVIYMKQPIKDFLKSSSRYLERKSANPYDNEMEIEEGIGGKLSSRTRDFVMGLTKDFKNSFNLGVRLESFAVDKAVQEEEVNLLIKAPGPSFSDTKDSDLRRVIKKGLRKLSAVKEWESYVDSPSTVYINILIDLRATGRDMTELSHSLSLFMGEILGI